MPTQTDDLRIKDIIELSPPQQIMSEIPATDAARDTVTASRAAIQDVLHNRDDRLVVIVGPCSIHDPQAAMEYAHKLTALREELKGELEVVMRVYFEKPRTTVGWKGLINDPDLDDSFQINKGLRLARKLLRDINELGLPAGTEFLDMTSPQYIADLVAWGAIGARTTESQVHRELSSGLSCPIGFKNGTDGGVKIAIDAVKSASKPHHFLAVTKSGQAAIAATTGNEDCHVILRGGNDLTNYDAQSVADICDQLEKAGMQRRIMIDASHANSFKKPENQPGVVADIAAQVAGGNHCIFGVMIESNLVAGRQDLKPGIDLTYGQSITDGCIDWQTTETVLRDLAGTVRVRRANRG